MARLGVNIDHIATVRQARRTFEPDPAHAVGIVERAGAYGIVCHLREDRRHVNERDLRLIRELCRSHLNLELAAADEIIEIARQVGPDTCTLVPERREEVTTEGGLDVAGQLEKLKKAVERLAPIPASAFIAPAEEQIIASLDAGFTAVELHTGEYAEASGPEREEQLARLARGAETAAELGLYIAAGHGLTYLNVAPVVELGVFAEFNIGHSIIARAVFTGLEEAVREMALLVG
ncbi:MAG TPA: pyridoxine 5'-phosphate synthase [Candidatus Coatesbacteria bacterium]|nr:pyridoxine 5'-phosphate synthase [Candidatus Coatesbacteria bacterium]